MCGFIFQSLVAGKVDQFQLNVYLDCMAWRGPDAQIVTTGNGGSVGFGHCRLSVIDPTPKANQPMTSKDGRYVILFNGEIYNHKDLRAQISLDCVTDSDTEVLLEGYAKVGDKIFSMLDGMFSVVIYDLLSKHWVAARDAFGIKPLYIHRSTSQTIIASEAAIIAKMVNAPVSENSLNEWRLIRRPIPGESFFEGVREVLPGSVVDSNGRESRHWVWEPSEGGFEQTEFERRLHESVSKHERSDVENVSLLSGGLDSAIILALSKVNNSYSVGLEDNNEFEGAVDTATVLGRSVQTEVLSISEMKDAWRYLTRLKGEPISVPNEALIYSVCASMGDSEKVVLTGEGADELLFGYDRIFRWALGEQKGDISSFLSRYAYSEINPTDRLFDYLSALADRKSGIEFVEDFFYQVHLPGLLRRMDFSSMAASKEARVPFVDKSMVSYCYRRPADIKLSSNSAKLPARHLAEKLGLSGSLQRNKVGFSAKGDHAATRRQEYADFRSVVLEALGW